MQTDYISRQDAVDAAMQYCPDDDGTCSKADKDIRELLDEIEDIPAADVVPVVRCKDCKHYYFADNRIPQEQRYVCEISGEIWKPDSFCSYGERREENNEPNN